MDVEILQRSAARAAGATQTLELLAVGEQPFIDVRQPPFNAVAGTNTDQKAAILAAINAGVATGLPVTGAGLTYGVAGNLEVTLDGSHAQDLTLKQLTPAAAGDLRTLTSNGVERLRFVRVKVDRNGDGTAGTINDDAGFYFNGGSGHYFEDCEVFGNDLGSGFVVLNATNFDAVRIVARDMAYLLVADPGDDVINGVWFASCSLFRAIECKAHDLGGDFGAGATTQYTRGLVFSGCTEFEVDDPKAWTLDQGVDFTGSGGNTRFAMTGGSASDCRSWGFKFANSARDGVVSSCVATRCGASGFVASAPGGALPVETGDLLFEACAAFDTGSNGFFAATASGFRVIDRPGFHPTGIKFSNCVAIDRQGVPTMQYGYLAEDGVGNNEVAHCTSIGHIIAPYSANFGDVSPLPSTITEVFTAGTTAWLHRYGLKAVSYDMLSAGGGGASGGKGPTTNNRTGGQGGSSGGRNVGHLLAAALSAAPGATQNVVVGAGGAGGASQATNSTSGNDGKDGGASSFNGIVAQAGVGGTGGSFNATTVNTRTVTINGVTFSSGTGDFAGSAGGLGNSAAGSAGASSACGGSGGGGGGLTVTTDATANGGLGGAGRNTAGATAGKAGVAPSGDGGDGGQTSLLGSVTGGGGGGGGASSATTNGGKGGAGKSYGSGGGGGGASLNAVGDSGAGGAGADGLVILVSHF